MDGRIGQMEQSMEERVRLLEARLESLNPRNDRSNIPPAMESSGQTLSLVSRIGGQGMDAHVEALECCLEQVLELMLPHVDALLTELEERIPILQALSHWSPLSESETIPFASSAKKGKQTKRKKKPLSVHIPLNGSSESLIQNSTLRDVGLASLQTSTSKEAVSSQNILPESTPPVVSQNAITSSSGTSVNRVRMAVEELPTQTSHLPLFANSLHNSMGVPLLPVPTSSALAAQRLANEHSSNSPTLSISNIDFRQIVVPSVQDTTSQPPSGIQRVSSSSQDVILSTSTSSALTSTSSSSTTRMPSLRSQPTSFEDLPTHNERLGAPTPKPAESTKLDNNRFLSHFSNSPSSYVQQLVSSSDEDDSVMNPMTEHFKIGSMLGNISYIREGLDAGVNINVQDDDGQTALHWASWNGHEDIVELLVRRGADLDVRNDYGLSALHMAASGGNAQCVAFLVDADVNINIRSSDQKTPLHLAAYKGNETAVIVLIAAGADVDLVDSDWNTPIDLASTDTIRKLLKPEKN